MIVLEEHIKKNVEIKSINDTYTFVLTSNIIDRENERMNVQGINFADYMNNPVVLYNHDGQDFPVGTMQRIWIENNKLLGEIVFHDIDAESIKAHEYVKNHVLNAVSIGFIPVEFKEDKINGKSIITFIKSNLLEVSLVALPANPEAIRIKNFFSIIKRENKMEIKEKAGAKFNRQNKDALQQILEMLTQMLAEDQAEDEGEDMTMKGKMPMIESDKLKSLEKENADLLLKVKSLQNELKVIEWKNQYFVK